MQETYQSKTGVGKSVFFRGLLKDHTDGRVTLDTANMWEERDRSFKKSIRFMMDLAMNIKRYYPPKPPVPEKICEPITQASGRTLRPYQLFDVSDIGFALPINDWNKMFDNDLSKWRKAAAEANKVAVKVAIPKGTDKYKAACIDIFAQYCSTDLGVQLTSAAITNIFNKHDIGIAHGPVNYITGFPTYFDLF